MNEKLQATANVQYIKNKGYNRPGTGYDELNPLMGFTWFGRNVDVGLLKSYMTDSTIQAYNRANGASSALAGRRCSRSMPRRAPRPVVPN